MEGEMEGEIVAVPAAAVAGAGAVAAVGAPAVATAAAVIVVVVAAVNMLRGSNRWQVNSIAATATHSSAAAVPSNCKSAYRWQPLTGYLSMNPSRSITTWSRMLALWQPLKLHFKKIPNFRVQIHQSNWN